MNRHRATRRALFAVLSCVCAASAAAGKKDEEEKLIRVYITPAPIQEETAALTEKEAEVRRDAAREALKPLEKKLSKLQSKAERNGEEKFWPTAVKEELAAAKREMEEPSLRLLEAELALNYVDWRDDQEDNEGKPKDWWLRDSANDVREATLGKGASVGRKDRIEVVGAAEQAHILVEVLGRYRDTCSHVVVKVTEGPGLAKGTLGKVEFRNTSWFKPSHRDLHVYTEANPFWVLDGQSCANSLAGAAFSRYGSAANALAKLLNKRVDKDWAVLKAGMTTQ